MRYKLKRAVSLLLSAVLAMSGVGNLITVSAEEIFPDVENVTEAKNIELEEMKYYITLPYYEECSYLFEREHLVESMEEQVSEEKKDIVLSYAADEKVEIILVQNGNTDITEVHLLDQEKEEISYEWKENAYGHFPRPLGPRSPARQGHIKRPVLRLAEQRFLHPANHCC